MPPRRRVAYALAVLDRQTTDRLPRRAVVLCSSAGLGFFFAAWMVNRWPAETLSAVERVRRWWGGLRHE